jgi:hypothetical protein
MAEKRTSARDQVLPDHSCRALEAIAPFITDKALQLAAERLSMTDEKVALLIVKAINPHEHLTIEEQALLRGVSRKTLGKMIANKETGHV